MLCVLISLPVAVPLAWLLGRRRFRGKLALEVLLHLPLVLPPVVTGYLLLLLAGRQGPLGAVLSRLGVQLAFHLEGAALASAVVGFPLMLRAIRLAIEAVDPRLEQAARSLGAGPWRTFFTVTLPLAGSGVLAGAILSFARSLGEFGATITFAGNIPGQTRTLPLAIYTALNRPGGDAEAAALAVASIVLSVVALGAGELLARRSRSC